MPGNVHRFLVQAIIVRARALGYEILASDANYYLLGGDRFRLPPKILRHSPDVIGGRKEPPHLLIGEAKTPQDLHTRHTKEQLTDFATVPDTVVLVAFPERCQPDFAHLLDDWGIHPGPLFQSVAVPEALLPS